MQLRWGGGWTLQSRHRGGAVAQAGVGAMWHGGEACVTAHRGGATYENAAPHRAPHRARRRPPAYPAGTRLPRYPQADMGRLGHQPSPVTREARMQTETGVPLPVDAHPCTDIRWGPARTRGDQTACYGPEDCAPPFPLQMPQGWGRPGHTWKMTGRKDNE